MGNLNAKIERIKSTEYVGWIYWTDDKIGDHFYPSVKKLVDLCKRKQVAIPREVNGCFSMGLSMNAEDVVESALEEHHENARDQIPNAEIDKLQKLLDAWCSEQKVATYFCDDSVIVEIDEAITPPADPRAPSSPSE